MNTDKYLAMTDTFMRQTGKGEIPEKITRDFRFCMDEQREKLRKKDVTMREEYVFNDEAVTGAAEMSLSTARTAATQRWRPSWKQGALTAAHIFP